MTASICGCLDNFLLSGTHTNAHTPFSSSIWSGISLILSYVFLSFVDIVFSLSFHPAAHLPPTFVSSGLHHGLCVRRAIQLHVSMFTKQHNIFVCTERCYSCLPASQYLCASGHTCHTKLVLICSCICDKSRALSVLLNLQ